MKAIMPNRWTGLVGLVALTAACGPSVSLEDQTAEYFALVGGVTFTYENEAGLTEEHSYEDETQDAEERLVFERVARRGGFIDDAQTIA